VYRQMWLMFASEDCNTEPLSRQYLFGMDRFGRVKFLYVNTVCVSQV
jgi:hypothetical protein